MATAVNTIDLTTLDDRVVELYNKLMASSTGADSVYIKAKETIQQLLATEGLTAKEKAQIVSQTITGMVNGLTAQAMQAAIDLAKDDRDAPFVLAKLDSDITLIKAQITRMGKESLNLDKDHDLKTAQGWLTQAQLYRDYGVIPNNLTGYNKSMLATADYSTMYGTKAEDIAMSRANRQVVYANNWRQNGKVVPVVDDNGYVISATEDNNGLMYHQIQSASKDAALKDKDGNLKQAQGWVMQAQLYRDYGVEAYNLGYTTETISSSNYDDYGVKAEEIASAKASRYIAYAGSWRQNGLVTPVIDLNGHLTSSTTADTGGMSYQQLQVAKKQEQGFIDNKYQHIINGSATMLGMLVSSESGTDLTPYLCRWKGAVDMLMTNTCG